MHSILINAILNISLYSLPPVIKWFNKTDYRNDNTLEKKGRGDTIS